MTINRGPLTHPRHGRFLICILSDKLAVAFVDETPKPGFVFGGKRYIDCCPEHWTGFYDWLRNPGGQIIGVRHWTDDRIRFTVDPQLERPYVDVTHDGTTWEIFFGDERSYLAEMSNDQDFGDNIIYSTSRGEIAISFGFERIENQIVRGMPFVNIAPLH